MCLGIPGRIVAFDSDNDQLARVDVMGMERDINVGLVREEGAQVGDWVLIHVGSALTVISEEEAALALEGLKVVGRGPEEEGADDPFAGATGIPQPPPEVAAWADY